MDTNTSIAKSIKSLLAHDRMGKAIELMIDFSHSNNLDCQTDIILFSFDFYSLENAVKRGRIKWEEERYQKRDLAFRMLQFTSNMRT